MIAMMIQSIGSMACAEKTRASGTVIGCSVFQTRRFSARSAADERPMADDRPPTSCPALVDRQPAAGAGQGLQADQRAEEGKRDHRGDDRVLEGGDDAVRRRRARREGRLAGDGGGAALVEDLGAFGTVSRRSAVG